MRAALICSLLLASTAFAEEKVKPAAKPAAKPDKTTAELKAFADKMNEAFLKMDLDYIKGAISDTPWITWDTDEAGRPSTQTTKADSIKMIDQMNQMMKAMGGKMSFTPKMMECRASGTMGVCLQEGEMTITSEKMPPMTMAFRETNVAMKEKGGWKWVHHHGSLAKWPELPAKSMAMTAKTAKWMDAPPGAPAGMKMSPVWMDPVHGGGVALIKIGPEGMKNARHIHPYGSAYLIVEGGMTTGIDGKDTEFGPGSVLYRAAKEPHTSTAKPNTVFLIVMDGPMANVLVDEKGAPLPPPATK